MVCFTKKKKNVEQKTFVISIKNHEVLLIYVREKSTRARDRDFPSL